MRDSPWTASTFELAHCKKYFHLYLHSHIIRTGASLSHLHQPVPDTHSLTSLDLLLSGFKASFPSGHFVPSLLVDGFVLVGRSLRRRVETVVAPVSLQIITLLTKGRLLESDPLCETSVVSLILDWKRCRISCYLSYRILSSRITSRIRFLFRIKYPRSL